MRPGRHVALTFWLGLIATLLAALPAFGPWMDPRLNLLLPIDDAKNHLLRLYHFLWLLERGEWYPRWVPDMFMGYGYPLLNFYAPGFYYLAAGVRLIFRTDIWDTLKLSGLTAALLGTAGLYALTHALWRRVLPAAFGALLLAYGPYVFQVNLWRRAALPEALALGIVPWLLLSLYRAWHAPPGQRLLWSVAGAGAGAALFLAHNLTAMAGFGMAAVWVASLAVQSGLQRGVWRSAAGALAPLALAVSLSSFFWMPAIAEGRLVHLEELWGTGGLDWHGCSLSPPA